MYPGKIGLGTQKSESMFTPYELAIMEGGHALEEAADPKAWIEKMYSKYQAWPMDSNQRVMVWGEGEEQQFAVFELKPSMSKRGAVEVAWFQAYPLRQGVGSRAMKELQAQAQADGIALTLYPWDKGRVSQAKLIKFYKQAGFKPATKGAKNMAWSPVGEATDSNVWPTTIRLGNYLNWHATEFEKADDYHDANDLIDAVEDLIEADVKPKIVTANPKALFATQDWLSNYGSDGSMFDEYDDLPVVYNKDNKAYILDGHHRVAKALKTNTPIKVYLFSKGTNINEGGWASTATQNTVITPRTVVEIMEALKTFESSFNTWQAKQELDVEIKIGGPKGSGTYYRRDLEQDPEREYGDVDVECFIHSRAGVSSAQRITEYRMAITNYCLQSPDYSTENGTNIIMKTSSGAVQVDMLYTFHEHANWSRALSPEYRVKGVISTSLTSSLAEVLNLSFSSQGIQVKIRNDQPVSFRQSKDVELRTVSTTPETWAQDIYSLYYYLAKGEKPSEFPGGLKAHGGLKDEQRLSDIVLSIKSLANAMEESGLLGHGSLIGIHDKKDMIRKVASVYSKKLETAENSSKFDKAQTPAAVEKAKKTKLMLAKYRNEITKLLLN
jgi:hypothetical protein